MSDPILIAENLHKSYGATHAVAGISLNRSASWAKG